MELWEDPAQRPLAIARIDESACIGCALCIAACPVDAIVGAAKRMHAVLPSVCTGCELCVAPCPVDCIEMTPSESIWTALDAAIARERHDAQVARLARRERIADRVTRATTSNAEIESVARSRRVARAFERARARRAAMNRSSQ